MQPVLLLLHGFLETPEMWEGNINDFAQQGYRVVTPQLMGHASTMEAMADQAYNAISGNAQNIVLIGHSMGGYVALAFAEKYPEFTKGVCLLHSTVFSDTEERKTIRNRVIDLVKHNKHAFTSGFFDPLFTPANAELHQSAIAVMKSRAQKYTEADIINALAGMRDRKNRFETFKNGNFAKGVIAGTYDLSIPVDALINLSENVSSAQFTLLEASAHMGTYEEPDKCLNAIHAFLAEANHYFI